jgi:hypothetical protein
LKSNIEAFWTPWTPCSNCHSPPDINRVLNIKPPLYRQSLNVAKKLASYCNYQQDKEK